MAYTDNDTYRHIHFAVMAIESGARKWGISGKEMHDRLQKQGLIHRRLIQRYEDLHTQSLEFWARLLPYKIASTGILMGKDNC